MNNNTMATPRVALTENQYAEIFVSDECGDSLWDEVLNEADRRIGKGEETVLALSIF